ncbi:hypothetical protein [Kitasatospora sp. NPDC088346]|uniref:hypothetical protein n=1 Tax=Kitasatospora sp. NPDC088346 TaxID=3364073 RepID=UPI00380E242A
MIASTGFLGANGAKVHGGALWVTDLDEGTLVRIPIRHGSRAGVPQVRATGLAGIDDFAFTGRGNEVLATRGLHRPRQRGARHPQRPQTRAGP